MEKHNISYELRLIELLEYRISGPDKSNRWIIFDKNNKQVGYIQFKKVSKGSKDRDKRFAYVTHIYSDNFIFDYIREVKPDVKNDEDLRYDFEINRSNGITDGIQIDLSDPLIRIWSNEYGYLEYHISDEEFFLDHQSKTESFNIEEFVCSRRPCDTSNDEKYVYQIKYCDKDEKIETSKNVTTREISGRYNSREHKPNTLELSEGVWIGGKNEGSNKQIVEGTVTEMIKKQEMGIDSINHFRYFIKSFLPINQEILEDMISDETLKKYGFESLTTEIENEKEERTTK